MKKRLLILLGACIFGATMGMAQTTLPLTITTDDGLPSQTGANNSFNEWLSDNYSFAEPLKGIRLTVLHTATEDGINTADNGSRGYVFFAIGEFFLYDKDGKKIALTEENVITNSDDNSTCVIGSLVDGDIGTFFHTTWNTTPNPPVCGEHYMEFIFPEPLTEFSIGMHMWEHGWLSQYPCKMIMTEAGVDANPYPDVEVMCGESVSELQEGKYYIFGDGGATFGFPTYVATAGVKPTTEYPKTSSNEYRIRKNVYADCLFEAINAGDGYFYLKSFMMDTYIKDAEDLQYQGGNIGEAGKFKMTENGLVSASGYNYYIANTATFRSSAETVSGLTAYEAVFSNTFYVNKLYADIEKAENALAQWKDTLAVYDQGEAAALESAISSAKEITNDSSYEEILAAQDALATACIEFMKEQAYAAMDNLQKIVDGSSFGTERGDYPYAQQEILNGMIEKISALIDDSEIKSIDLMISSLTDMNKEIETILYNLEKSKITLVEFPLLLTSKDGLPYNGMPTDIHSFTEWTSPTFSVAEPIEGFRLTVTHTAPSDDYNVMDNGSRGYLFFSVGELYLYDEYGNKIALTEDNVTSNADEASDGVLSNLVDGDNNTYFHSTWNTSNNPVAGGEHYIEITFPEPLSNFAFGLYRREIGWLTSFPNVMYVSNLGETPDPYSDFEFKLGEKVSKVEPNKMYVINDNGLVYDKPYYVSSVGIEPGYAANSDFRIREVPFADCVFITVDAGDGKFYLQNLSGKYVNNAYGRLTQTTSLASAAELYVDENGCLMSTNGYNLRTSNTASFEASDADCRPMSFYAAEVKGSYLSSIFNSTKASAEKALNMAQEAVMAKEEYKALEQLVSEMQFDETASSTDILASIATISQATLQLLKVEIGMYGEELFSAMNDNTFGLEIGSYPTSQFNILQTTYNDLCNFVDANPNASAAKYLEQVSKIYSVLNTFYSSKFLAYSSWPFTDKAPEGSPLGAIGKTGKQTYTSPMFLMEQPVKKFYMTNVHNPAHNHYGSGYDYMTICNFSVFDAEGNEVPLTVDNFATNATEPIPGCEIEYICDRNEDGTPNVNTLFHTIWSYSAPEVGEHWVSVELPEALSAFSFEFCSREAGTMPNELVVGLEPYRSVYPEDETLSINDFVGDCTWRWNDYWTPADVKSFDAKLTKDPEVENGLILSSFNGYGPIKGVFNGTAHTITFPSGQAVDSCLVFTSKKGTDIVFNIDAESNTIKYSGQAGINVLDSETKEATNQWKGLSYNWITLSVDNTGVRVMQTPATVINEACYTIDGRKVENPSKGIHIIKRTYSDGTVSTQKIIVK